MRRAIFWLVLLVFLAASLPAALLAEEQVGLRFERRPSHGHPPHFERPPAPPFNVRPSRPGRPGFRPPHNRPRPPQWSISIHNRPGPVRPWYGTCPPYCVYNLYRDDDREAKTQTKYFTEETEAPEAPTYFQSDGPFERMEGAAAAPPPPGRDGPRTDMDSYELMMRAWQ